MKKSTKLRVQMASMMFLQYMMYAVWWVPLAAYLTNMDVGSSQKALILSSMAIGCMASPLIGMLADRFFEAQKVLAGLNLVNALMLLGAGNTQDADVLFFFLLFAMLAYMPSWSLTSSIAMTHIPSEQFPKVRVFGSIGWVVSGIFSIVFIRLLNIEFDGTNIPFYCGAGVSLFAAFANTMLPNTPSLAKGEKATFADAFGLGTIQMLKDKNFAVFILLSFLSMIPFAMYYSYFSEFLLYINTKYISVTINWGVLFEMAFMLLIPMAIKKIGLRRTMILGLIALTLRYLAFYTGMAVGQTWMYYIGILIHGLIFGFFYVGGQIYIDKKAPRHLRAQAQGFIFLVTFGLGLLVGNFICATIIDYYKTLSGFNWENIWGVTTLISLILLILFVVSFQNLNVDKFVECTNLRGGGKGAIVRPPDN